MTHPILLPEIQAFIEKNLNKSVNDIAFQKNPFEGTIDWKELLSQIQAKQKAKNKLPLWFGTPNIIFPSPLSIEQTSSETTAAFKASLIQGETLIDLTGGYGIDDYFFAKNFTSVTHCEMNTSLSDIVNHNTAVLGCKNLKSIPGDSTITLQELDQTFDWIYIDPARRDDSQNKVFLLEDCTPDVVNLLSTYFKYSQNIMIKTSPLLDFHNGIKALKGVKCIHIVALKNEVKELLWILEKDYTGDIKIQAHNINGEKIENFESALQDDYTCEYAAPQQYLYEPNAAIMKAGAFKYLANQFSIKKLAEFSHLYTHDSLIDFPGRRFFVVATYAYNKPGMATLKQFKQANITTRNFPESVADLRKKLKINDGGNDYLFFTTNHDNEKIVVHCKKA